MGMGRLPRLRLELLPPLSGCANNAARERVFVR